jgi:hypothetical protein
MIIEIIMIIKIIIVSLVKGTIGRPRLHLYEKAHLLYIGLSGTYTVLGRRFGSNSLSSLCGSFMEALSSLCDSFMEALKIIE